MLHRSTIQLLRFPFSYFLMPVFWFALSFVNNINWPRTIFAFALVHLLLYPSSNGYNSFMDRDTESIGGLEKPMQPTRELFYATVIMDVTGLILSFFISWQFAAGFAFYILCSRMYSYRGIRLKRFAVAGYFIVILNQGALIFAMTYHAASENLSMSIPLQGMVAAAFLIGGFYPITQIYQHKADAKDGVETISMMMGKKGTFIFCAVMYAVAFTILFLYYREANRLMDFVILQIFFIAVIIYFVKWMLQVWKNESIADFKHTMRMNMLASTCTNFAFITLILLQRLG
ncbi:MAG TPA: UbiA family prenyltransferase [Chitinophagaceae bacterium]